MTYICLTCLKDSYLRQTLAKEDEPCEYCDASGPSASIFSVAQECDRVLETHFEPTQMQPAVVIYGRTPAGHDLRETLHRLDIVPEIALDDLIEDLQFQWFDRDTMVSKYADDADDEPWFRLRSDLDATVGVAWARMETSLQHEARYLNPEAIRVLDDVLGDIHSDRTVDGHSVVVDAGPGTGLSRLYRARVFQTEGPLVEALGHPARLLGTPAPGVGPAGRMNAKGQPAFYGATAVAVALLEVRPPVGAWVVTAAFDLVRTIRLLDLRGLGRVQLDPRLSLFNPSSLERAQRKDFLRTLASRLVQPVMPDLQDRDYLVTQVVADYLASHRQGQIDGIIYPSVQTRDKGADAGYNIALFPRASRVEGADGRPPGQASLWEYEEDGPGRHLLPEVWRFREPIGDLSPNLGAHDHSSETHRRWPITLALVQSEVEVHTVTSVDVSTRSTPVSFRRPSP